MQTEEAIYFAAILLIGVPASFRLPFGIRNPTAFAMIATWAVCRFLYAITGEGMSVQAMVVSDMFVIAAMFLKEDWQSCDYATMGRQLCALWWERTPWDRTILALFPVVWILYAPVIDPNRQFWALWGLGLAQLIAAGLEALHQWQRANGQASRAANEGPPGLSFTALGRGYG